MPNQYITASEKYTAILFDSTGSKIKATTFTATKNEVYLLPMNDIANGNYFITVYDSNRNQVTSKIIVKVSFE